MCSLKVVKTTIFELNLTCQSLICFQCKPNLDVRDICHSRDSSTPEHQLFTRRVTALENTIVELVKSDTIKEFYFCIQTKLKYRSTMCDILKKKYSFNAHLYS